MQVSGQNWSEPVLLFEVDGAKSIQEPNVLGDAYGNVHIFWQVQSGTPGEYGAIYYMRKDAIGWTAPVDIISVPRVLAVSAVISPDDYIYIVWNGANDILTYSRAPILGAESAQNWSEPTALTEGTQYASIAPSPDGNVYLAYAGKGNSAVYEQVIESNNLDSFSPRIIAQNSLTTTGSDYVQMRVSSNGTRHVVWTEFYLPEFWPPRGVFYARSLDGGDTWSAPELLAPDGADQMNITLVDDNNIHVAWNGFASMGGRYHRWSSDGGMTWSETYDVIPAGIGGTEGPPEIFSDHTGVVHMLTTHSGCAWYTYFKNQIWAAPVCISGEEARVSNFIEQPAMGVSEGNKLHAVFWDDRKRLWYTTKVTDAPWIPPQVIDQEVIQPTPEQGSTESPNVIPTQEATSLPAVQQLEDPKTGVINPSQIMLLSLLPVLFLIVLMLAIKSFKKTS